MKVLGLGLAMNMGESIPMKPDHAGMFENDPAQCDELLAAMMRWFNGRVAQAFPQGANA